MKIMKKGLDIDGVLCNFPQGVIERAKTVNLSEHFPPCCHDVMSWDFGTDKFSAVMKDAWLSVEFWLKLKPLAYSLPLSFTPDCYITSRPVENWVTEQWLDLWKFPKADVITVKNPLDKLEVIKERKLDLFVDDYIETVRHLRENGVNALLFEAPYQRGHEHADLPKIKCLSEVENYGKELSANSR